MQSIDTLLLAIHALKRNGMRSILTTLGIIIGVGSVVTMVSVGSSFQAYILNQLDGIGDSMIEILPKGLEQIGKRNDTLTEADANAIRALTTIKAAYPSNVLPYTVQAKGESISPLILATYPEVLKNYNLQIAYGREIDDSDLRAARAVAVIGPDAAEDLFGRQNVVGEKITVNTRTFTIIGVHKPAGSLIGQQMDGLVAIPFTLGKILLNQDHVTYIIAYAERDIDFALLDITQLLRQRHGIKNPTNDPDKDDFIARSTEQATQIIGTVTLSITAFLVLVAGVSLLVGGIGIMNIMLVSVTERTPEIGLRKAVGAKKSDILTQFLCEAILLTVLGGIIGIICGIIIALLASAVANKFLGDFPFVVSYNAIGISVLTAFVVGIVFGLLPAKKAANLSPIEAMRAE